MGVINTKAISLAFLMLAIAGVGWAQTLAELRPGPIIKPKTSSTPNKSLNSNAPADQSAIKVPFDLSDNNILVQVRINNSQPLWFVFDSGAGVNLINQRTAEKLGMTSKGSSVLDASGGMVTGSVIEQTTISLADVKASHQTIVAVPLDTLAEYSGRDVQGLIGNNFIQNFVVEIDYAQRILVFHNPQNYNLAGEPETIALENHGGTPFIEAELSLDGKATITDSFEIDTGSDGIISLNKPFAEKNRILQVVPKRSIAEGRAGAGVGGELRTVNARINGIKIGKYTLNKPVISIVEDKGGNAANHMTGFQSV